MKSVRKMNCDVERTDDLFILRADLSEKVRHCVEFL